MTGRTLLRQLARVRDGERYRVSHHATVGLARCVRRDRHLNFVTPTNAFSVIVVIVIVVPVIINAVVVVVVGTYESYYQSVVVPISNLF